MDRYEHKHNKFMNYPILMNMHTIISTVSHTKIKIKIKMGIEIKISKLNTRINKRCSTKAIRTGTMIFFV